MLGCGHHPSLSRFSARGPANGGHQILLPSAPGETPFSKQLSRLAGQIPTGGLYRFKAPYPVTSSQRYLIPTASFFCEDLVMRRSLNLKVCLLSTPLPARRTTDREWTRARGAKAPHTSGGWSGCPTRHQGSLVIQAKMWAGAQGFPSQPTRQEKGLR